MLGDLARERYESTLKVLNTPFVARLAVDLRGVPVIFGQTDDYRDNPHVRYTIPMYRIKYMPSFKTKHRTKPVLLETDLYLARKLVRFDTYEDLVEMAKEDEVIAFLLKWTNLSVELIEQCKRYVQIPIPFYFDTVKYEEEMRKQLGDSEYSVFKDKWISEMEAERLERAVKEKINQQTGVHARMKKEAMQNAKY